MSSLFKNWRTTYERIDKFLSDVYFTDVNLTNLINAEVAPLQNISHLKLVTNPDLSEKDDFHLYDKSALKYNEVDAFDDDRWENVNIETFTFGETWSIHWFRLNFIVPSQWLKLPNHSVDLEWNSGCEMLVFQDGSIIQGLNSTHSRNSVSLLNLTPSNKFDNGQYVVHLQASCSDLFGAGDGGLIKAPSTNKRYKIKFAQLRLVFEPARKLNLDLRLLMEFAETFKDTERGYQALFVANSVVNVIEDLKCDNIDRKMVKALKLTDEFFKTANGPRQFTLHAIGHCHMDTAWLWRYGETRRKIARSWSNVLQLLKKYPQMTFVCSQAQQLQWLKDDHPDLFRCLQSMAERNQFVPTGGTWIEMDANLPCTESLCRQFLYGQRFFKQNFGSFCSEFWLPDSFGYSPQLPQIMKSAQICRFVTQKISWSLVNKFPHHTFLWKGLDGSCVLTHFPPGDSYSMSAKISEIVHSCSNFADKGRSSDVMYIYGHGDGGQGPTQEMVQALDRLGDCDGLPRVIHSTPAQFFQKIENNDLGNLCTWKGELFLELHNGTYTTQRQLKLLNVHCEQMLRVVEMLLSMASVSLTKENRNSDPQKVGDIVPFDFDRQSVMMELESLWKVVLLNQFHDVLPGSCIEHVSDDAFWSYRDVLSRCQSTVSRLVSTVLNISSPLFINPTSWQMTISVPGSSPHCFINIPSHSIVKSQSTSSSLIESLPNPSLLMLDDHPMSVPNYQWIEDLQLHQITNGYFEITVDDQCRIHTLRILSLNQKISNLVTNSCPANQLVMYHDVPLFWDAWDIMDYHLETGVNIDSMPSFCLSQSASVTIQGATVSLNCQIQLSNTGTVIEQSVIVHGHRPYVQLCTKIVQWREHHRLLKVKIPTVSNTVSAQYRTHCGYHSRPTHRNTSWDAAKYEVCGHEWVHVGDANWGLSVLKEAIFGSSVDGGTIFLSLLRSPSSPDASADKKHVPHIFNYALLPLTCSSSDRFAATTILATQFNWECFWNEYFPFKNDEKVCAAQQQLDHHHNIRSFPIKLISPVQGEVAIDWIKPGCEDTNKIVLRLHENVGGKYVVKLKSCVSLKSVSVTDILEEEMKAGESKITFTSESMEVIISPFEIMSIMIDFVS